MNCTKRIYISKAAAEEALQRVVAIYQQRNAGGRSWKRLVAYQCKRCQQWHLGRDSTARLQQLGEDARNQPVKKIPSAGEVRRRMRRITERLDGERLHKLYQIGLEIQAEQKRDYEKALACIYGEVGGPR